MPVTAKPPRIAKPKGWRSSDPVPWPSISGTAPFGGSFDDTCRNDRGRRSGSAVNRAVDSVNQLRNVRLWRRGVLVPPRRRPDDDREDGNRHVNDGALRLPVGYAMPRRL